MGYGTITVRITGGQSVKIEIMGRHIELEANHRWKKCNYPQKKKDFLLKSIRSVLCKKIGFVKENQIFFYVKERIRFF